MCLLLIAHEAHPAYPLVLLANRDEFYARPTAPLDYWSHEPAVLAGRDLEAGGSWLGITRGGRLAAVTNYREPRASGSGSRSRGQLVSDFLTSRADPVTFLENLGSRVAAYRGFNLIVGDIGRPVAPVLCFFSNRGSGVVKLTAGIHGLSNHLLDTPWPKVSRGKAGLARMLQAAGEPQPEQLLELLRDTTRPADDELPDTGVGLDRERILSPLFIASETYGTRSSSVILVSAAGEVIFGERTYAPGNRDASQYQTRWQRFSLDDGRD